MFDEQQSASPSVPPAVAPDAPIIPLPEPKKSHKGRFIAIALVFLLLAGGAAAAAYYYLTVISVTPEKMMGRMYMAMQEVSSGSVDFTLTGSGTGVPKSPLYVPADTDAAAVAVEQTMTVEVGLRFDDAAEKMEADVSFTATTDGADVTTFSGEVVSLNDIDYLQLTALATPMIPDELQSGIAMVLNRWIVIDKNEIAKSLKIDDLVAELNIADNEDTTTRDAVNAVLAEKLPNVVVITNTLESEVVDGVSTVHYAYSIDKNAVGELLGGVETAMDSENDQFDVVREFLGKSDDITGELWIAKSDALLRKVTMETGMKGAEQFTLSTTLLLSDYGASHDVVAPEDATPIEDVFFEVLTKISEDAKADDDGDGLQNSDEDKYDTDRANPDTDGDGYTDGAEVDGGYNPNGEGALVDLSDNVLERVEFDD